MISEIKSHAKLNLFLHVTGQRPDGYHELSTLMTRISLHDVIRFDFSVQQISVVCSHPDVPEDSTNLAHRAAEKFYAACSAAGKADVSGTDASRGVRIEIEKTIPPGGGLGGGSSNAAAVLVELNRFYGTPLPEEKLLAIGLEIGADVPFFISGIPALATGVGERLAPVDDLPLRHVVLCDPGIAASTAAVYKNLDLRLTLKLKYIKSTGSNTQMLNLKNDLKSLMHNDLEASACALYPEIGKTKEEMSGLLRQAVYMTGSGSSLFALYQNRQAAEQGYETLVREWAGTDRKLFVSSFC